MMTMVLKDRSEVVVTDDQGIKIQESLIAEAEFIRIEGSMYSRKSIDKVIPGGVKPKLERFVDPWAKSDRMIMPGKECKSTRSIQAEINNVIKAESGREWAKAIRDKDERERIRQILLDGDSEWCDYIGGTCVC
jgi:hypothetical protein